MTNFFQDVISGSNTEITRKLRNLESRKQKLDARGIKPGQTSFKKVRPAKLQRTSTLAVPDESPEKDTETPTPRVVVVPPAPDPPNNSSVSEAEVPDSEAPDIFQSDSLSDIESGDQSDDSELDSSEYEEAESEVSPAVMAPRLTKKEQKARTRVRTSLLQVTHWLNQAPVNIFRAELAINQAEAALEEARDEGLDRIAVLTGDEFTAAQEDYIREITALELEYDTRKEAFDTANPASVSTDDQLATDKAIAQKRIDQHSTEIEALITAIRESLQAVAADQQLNKDFVIGVNAKIANIRVLLRPQLITLHSDLIALDKSAYNTVINNQSALLQTHDKALDELVAALAAKNLSDASLTFMPGANSTSVNTSVVVPDISSSSSSSRSRNYYGKRDYPVFNGDPITYPAWREEMQQEVLHGLGDAASISIVAQTSPHKDLAQHFTKMTEVWEEYNRLYANPRVVSGKITKEFLSKQRLEGFTDEAKLISLHKLIRRCHLTLDIVKQTHQLTDNQPMLERAISLMPRKYKEQYADVVDNAEAAKTPPGPLTAAEEYAALSKWLEKKSNQLKVHLKDEIDMIKPESSDCESSSESPSGSGAGDNGKDGRNRRKKGDDPLNPQNWNHVGGKPADGAHPVRGSTRYGDSCLATLSKENMDQIKKEWDKMKECPVCKAPGHAYESAKEQGKWHASSCLSDCKTFVDSWDLEKKAKFMVDNDFCVRCLSRRHKSKECRHPKEHWHCRVPDNNGQACGQLHHNILHGCKTKLWM